LTENEIANLGNISLVPFAVSVQNIPFLQLFRTPLHQAVVTMQHDYF